MCRQIRSSMTTLGDVYWMVGRIREAEFQWEPCPQFRARRRGCRPHPPEASDRPRRGARARRRRGAGRGVIEAFAPAKINLALHITGQRQDGYHLLDSLVVFAGIGDRLTIREAQARKLTVNGPFAAGVPTGPRTWFGKRLIGLTRPCNSTSNLKRICPMRPASAAAPLTRSGNPGPAGLAPGRSQIMTSSLSWARISRSAQSAAHQGCAVSAKCWNLCRDFHPCPPC